MVPFQSVTLILACQASVHRCDLEEAIGNFVSTITSQCVVHLCCVGVTLESSCQYVLNMLVEGPITKVWPQVFTYQNVLVSKCVCNNSLCIKMLRYQNVHIAKCLGLKVSMYQNVYVSKKTHLK